MLSAGGKWLTRAGTGGRRKRGETVFVTLMYHLVDDAIDDANAVARRAFADQMALLQDEGYACLSIEAAAAIAQGELAPPPRALLITFDDGYAGNVDVALPLLTRCGLCATMFVLSAYVGQNNRWNPKACYDVAHAGWDGLRTWLAAGCTVGGHSHAHLCMTRLAAEEVRQAVRLNRELLAAELGCSLVGFSYPYGVYNAQVKRIVAESYAIAFSDVAGTWSPTADRYAINRIGVRPEWDLKEFRRRIDLMGRLAASTSAPQTPPPPS